MLDQLAAQVEISNQNLKQSEAAYRQALALLRQGQSALYPTIGYTGVTQQTSSSGGLRSTTGTVTNSVGQFTAGATLSWEIDLWGRLRRTIESDQAAAQVNQPLRRHARHAHRQLRNLLRRRNAPVPRQSQRQRQRPENPPSEHAEKLTRGGEVNSPRDQSGAKHAGHPSAQERDDFLLEPRVFPQP